MISSRMMFRTNALSRSSIALLTLALLVAAAACGDSGPEPSTPTAGSRGPATAAPARPVPERTGPRPKIVAVGDSLTAGFGLERDDSYPALLEQMLEERGYNYEVVNAGVSGDTSAGGLRRLDRALQGDVDVVIIALGGNDGLRGLPVAELEKNINAMIDKAEAKGAKVLLAGMEAPPYLGPEYTAAFREVYRKVGEQRDVETVPFLLDGVAGRRELNQEDGIHPNREGTRKVAETVLSRIEPLLEK
jgi:acyl-CoA thioesterase-1